MISSERLEAVDFSIPVLTTGFVGIIPYKREKVTVHFLRPFDWKIWISVACLTITFLIVFALTDLAFNGYIRWWNLVEFSYRLMLMHSAATLPDKRMYNRVLVCVWLYGFLILAVAYLGKDIVTLNYLIQSSALLMQDSSVLSVFYSQVL